MHINVADASGALTAHVGGQESCIARIGVHFGVCKRHVTYQPVHADFTGRRYARHESAVGTFDLKPVYNVSAPDRVRILHALNNESKNINTLATELNIPPSSVAHHIEILSDAQLVFVSYLPGLKGHVKYCSHVVLKCIVHISTAVKELDFNQEYSEELPVGIFSDCNIKAPCGMVGLDGKIGNFDDPNTFFTSERINAECLWFGTGFISYDFPVAPLMHHKCSEISFSFEICSEAIYYNNNWPSDITVYVNGVETTTFTSPGDFGGRRGRYTPENWPITSTQFGILKKISINGTGVFIDNVLVNDKVTFGDLKLYDSHSVRLTIGIKEDAVHRGGINLFGKNFGDYPQSIIMSVR